MRATVIERCSNSPAETAQAAAELAGRLRAGVTVALFGELGAGKTTFARALCRALGVTEPVASPGFTLVHEYRGAVPVIHADLYRLRRDPLEIASLGLDDVPAEAIRIIEWADRAPELCPANAVRVEIRVGPSPTERRIRMELPE
ncbi:MAG: tRNA (adenosine(37)-N6)-threonylcarbamoyltransferase complex ATPase subunit type 1 TsaE [Kiritimatiellae bacterium]|nr:tRNA (adenosine(37)-N6)-threonylcarbamoyltransferase complex ATPase subunit type 1 TsaE [Kiritimatiellia bacterium]